MQAVFGFGYIDFLSVDIQGGELDLLMTIDWSIPIGVICIELEGQHPAKEHECRQILCSHGFVFSGKLLISEIWFNPLYERKNLVYDASKKLELEAYQFSEYSLKHLPNLLATLSSE